MKMPKYNLLLTASMLILLLCSFSSCSDGGRKDDGEDPASQEWLTEGDVTIYVTTSTRSQDFKKQSAAFSKEENKSPTTLRLEPAERYQTMDGFGAAVTGSTAFNLLQMKPEDRTRFLRETFSETEGMGQSYIRISIGCSDFSLSEYSCCDEPGIEHFALTGEENDYVIPVLKEILAINPDVKIMGSPWTPPRWMKVNNLTDLEPFNSWTSGQLNPAHYGDYAGYFVKWIRAFGAEGISIYSVTPQNEPLNRGNSASLYMTWQEQRDFVKNALGPQMAAAGLKTKIYVYDHNYNYDSDKVENADQGQFPLKIYADSEAAGFIAGAAYHNYGGNKGELNHIHQSQPDKELVFTETSIGTWNDGRDLETRLIDDMREVALGTVNNWCRGVIVWNLMLDTDRGPNREGGCQTCYGAVDIDRNDYASITRNSHYYIVGHLSSVVKPGAVRIGTSGFSDSGFHHAAFENTDGTYAVVLLNSTAAAKVITLDDGANHFTCEVPAKAVISYRWNK